MEFVIKPVTNQAAEVAAAYVREEVFGREWHLSTPRLHGGGVFMATGERIMPSWKAHVPENGG
jgi:hypothetical protein